MREYLQHLNWEKRTLSVSFHFCCSLRGFHYKIGISGRNEYPTQKSQKCFVNIQSENMKSLAFSQTELFEYLTEEGILSCSAELLAETS